MLLTDDSLKRASIAAFLLQCPKSSPLRSAAFSLDVFRVKNDSIKKQQRAAAPSVPASLLARQKKGSVLYLTGLLSKFKNKMMPYSRLFIG
jgi:hypothetical protein